MEVQIQIFLINNTWKSGQIHVPAALPTGTEPSVPTGLAAERDPELDRILYRGETSRVPAENRTPIPRIPARSYSD
jgi:hypothetical protein